MRLFYAIGFAYTAISSVALLTPMSSGGTGEWCRVAPQWASDTAKEWFCSVKPQCNAVEALQTIRGHPPPSGSDGEGYAAACLALGGRMDEARRHIEAASDRGRASAVVFAIAHPVADAGDDRAAGPIMHLVLEFMPKEASQYYMALYHAGMSDYALGEPTSAKDLLIRFRQIYRAKDYFGTNADKVLDRIDRGLPSDGSTPGVH